VGLHSPPVYSVGALLSVVLFERLPRSAAPGRAPHSARSL